MTTVKDLIAHLQTRNPNAQIFLMTQRKQPFENYLAGVVGREEMTDQRWRFEPGIAPDDVFLVVGQRIRPGSLSAWIVAEHQAAMAAVDAASPAVDTAKPMAETLADIARRHLRLDLLEDVGSDSADFHDLATADIHSALKEAYLAGHVAREDGASPDGEVKPRAATETEQPHSV